MSLVKLREMFWLALLQAAASGIPPAVTMLVSPVSAVGRQA